MSLAMTSLGGAEHGGGGGLTDGVNCRRIPLAYSRSSTPSFASQRTCPLDGTGKPPPLTPTLHRPPASHDVQSDCGATTPRNRAFETSTASPVLMSMTAEAGMGSTDTQSSPEASIAER